MCWVAFRAGRPADFDNSRTRHTVLAVGAGVVCWICFSCLSFLCSFSLSLGNGPMYTEILSERAVILKTTNQNSIKCSL